MRYRAGCWSCQSHGHGVYCAAGSCVQLLSGSEEPEPEPEPEPDIPLNSPMTCVSFLDSGYYTDAANSPLLNFSAPRLDFSGRQNGVSYPQPMHDLRLVGGLVVGGSEALQVPRALPRSLPGTFDINSVHWNATESRLSESAAAFGANQTVLPHDQNLQLSDATVCSMAGSNGVYSGGQNKLFSVQFFEQNYQPETLRGSIQAPLQDGLGLSNDLDLRGLSHQLASSSAQYGDYRLHPHPLLGPAGDTGQLVGPSSTVAPVFINTTTSDHTSVPTKEDLNAGAISARQTSFRSSPRFTTDQERWRHRFHRKHSVCKSCAESKRKCFPTHIDVEIRRRMPPKTWDGCPVAEWRP